MVNRFAEWYSAEQVCRLHSAGAGMQRVNWWTGMQQSIKKQVCRWHNSKAVVEGGTVVNRFAEGYSAEQWCGCAESYSSGTNVEGLHWCKCSKGYSDGTCIQGVYWWSMVVQW